MAIRLPNADSTGTPDGVSVGGIGTICSSVDPAFTPRILQPLRRFECL
ncbi:MAG TPA: hypothetical protein VGL38_09205 [bacterium]